jgi:hypothetical protein
MMMKSHQVSCRVGFDVVDHAAPRLGGGDHAAPRLGGDELELEALVPVFHAWIREHALEDEVMIDVADYAHVVDGPGVLLVCHEGHYVIERKGGRWSLVYNRKRGGEGASLQERLRVPLRRLARAAALLAEDATLPKIRFRTEELVLRIYDRLHAPNEDATLSAIRGGLDDVLGRIYGGAVDLAREGEPRELFTVRVKARSTPPLTAFAG